MTGRDLIDRCLTLYLTAFKSFAVGILALARIVCIVLSFVVARITGGVMRVADSVDAWQPAVPGVFRWQ